jgi:subtilisin family serine protease
LKRVLNLLLPLAALGVSASAHAAVLAIVDSGTDLLHKDLKAKAWVNPGEVDDAVDNDDNGYVDDLNGWNFAENDNKVIDRKYIGTFSRDCYTYFELQTKALKGEATQAEKDWMKAKINDPSFLKELEKFGNFVHGTHVAGIAARDAAQARIMALKLIPTERPGASVAAFAAAESMLPADGIQDILIRMGLKALAQAQGKGLAPIAAYMKGEKAQVVNCSFGSSAPVLKETLRPLIEKILKRPATDAEMDDYVKVFMDGATQSMADQFVKAAPNALFVIAAGNDGQDNDAFGAVPANVRTDNSITVAATLGRQKLAYFSNYGQENVDIAAPGVGIRSTAPGDEYLEFSGTSQATPHVANAAGLILDSNPKLTPAQVKQILMQTVDVKAFLKGMVSTSGMLNTDRAVRAAVLSVNNPIEQAIAMARSQVKDASEEAFRDLRNEPEFVLPLPALPL